ncbi:MAG: tetratricopeptide repeat protein [Armatimonadota bacterium]
MTRRLVFAVILLAASCGFAQQPTDPADAPDPIAEANALYRDGQFAAAAESYRDALEAGFDGPRVHYNLGNALYRSDQLGEAVAHYLSALTIAPRDDDIQANLDRALSERPAGRPAPHASWFHATASRIVSRFTLSEFAVAAAVCWWSALGALIALLIGTGRRRTMRRVAIAAGIVAVSIASFGVARWWAWHHTDRAVVVAESAPVRAGPGESFEAALSVQEGSIVRIIRPDSDWVEIAEERGATGWLPTSSLAMVRPQVTDTDLPDG